MKVDKEFRSRLERLKPAIGTGSSIVELGHIWFDGKHVCVTNGAIGIRMPLTTEWACGVHGTALLGLLPEKEGELAWDVDELVLKVGRAKVKIAALDSARSPWAFKAKAKTDKEFVLTEEFIAALKRVSCIKPDVPVRVEHWGVTLFPDEAGVLLYTSDSKSAAEVLVRDAKVPAKLAKTVLPRAFVSLILDFALPGDKCSVGEFIAVHTAEAELYCSLLDSSTVQDLPSLVSDLLPPGKFSYTTLPAGLKDSISRVAYLHKGKDAAHIKLKAGSKKLTVYGKYALGELSDSLPLKAEGSGEISVNLHSLETALAWAKGFFITDSVLIMVGDPDNDILFVIAAHVDERAEKAAAKKRKEVVEEDA